MCVKNRVCERSMSRSPGLKDVDEVCAVVLLSVLRVYALRRQGLVQNLLKQLFDFKTKF